MDVFAAFDDDRADAESRADARADRRADRTARNRADNQARAGRRADFNRIALIELLPSTVPSVSTRLTLSPLTGKTSVTIALKLLQRFSFQNDAVEREQHFRAAFDSARLLNFEILPSMIAPLISFGEMTRAVNLSPSLLRSVSSRQQFDDQFPYRSESK
jgi:hypothetical protein